MTIDVKKGAVCAAIVAVLLAAAPARADVLSEMNNFWRGAAVNTTGPASFAGSDSSAMVVNDDKYAQACAGVVSNPLAFLLADKIEPEQRRG